MHIIFFIWYQNGDQGRLGDTSFLDGEAFFSPLTRTTLEKKGYVHGSEERDIAHMVIFGEGAEC